MAPSANWAVGTKAQFGLVKCAGGAFDIHVGPRLEAFDLHIWVRIEAFDFHICVRIRGLFDFVAEFGIKVKNPTLAPSPHAG